MRVPLSSGGPALVIAHRGASAHAPENTLPAFDLAFAGGARWIEADVQPTADGAAVILHDDNVDRTSNGQGAVRDLTAAQIAALDAGSWFRPEFVGVGVPTLTELLDLLPVDGHLLLEIKGPHTPAQLRVLRALVDGHPASSRVALQSFEVDALQVLRAHDAGVPLGLLREELDPDPVAVCHDLGASSYNPEVTELLERPGVVAALHQAGIAVAVWTSDDPAQWAALTALGVDAIITNTPADLLAWQHTPH